MPNTAAVNNPTHAHDVLIETLVAVSRICLQRTDELVTLNAHRLREILADSTTLMGGWGGLAGMSQGGLREARSDVLAPVIERTLSYSRNLYEIVVQTQAELAELMHNQMAVSDMKTILPSPWQDVATMFAKTTEKLTPAFRRSASPPAGNPPGKR